VYLATLCAQKTENVANLLGRYASLFFRKVIKGTMGIDLNRSKRIYQKLMRIAPELASIKEYAKSEVEGYMALSCDVLETGRDFRRIALSHFWKHGSSDMIPDPDMEIAVFFDWELAEAMTYQDAFRYDDAYPVMGEPPDFAIHGSINSFLESWLTALAEQGHVLK
jgi:uncharacterized protein YqiB (DUF1249 family)